MRRFVLAALAAASLLPHLGAQTVSLPNTFSAGAPISAAAMNADFQALVTAVNSLQAQMNAGIPIGTVISSLVAPDAGSDYMSGSTVWALADGVKPADATAYTGVFPDMRGEFLRGVDDGSAHDPNASTRTTTYGGATAGVGAGTYQTDAVQDHKHYLWLYTGLAGINAGVSPGVGLVTNQSAQMASVDPSSGRVANETRPTNVSVYWYIKVR
jgi:hypothetical protein